MIKRPLLWILGSYVIGILSAWYQVSMILIILSILIYSIVLIFLIYSFKKLSNRDRFLWVLPLLLLMGFYGMGSRMRPAPADQAFEASAPCTTSGEITMIVKKSWGRALYVKDNQIQLSGYDPFLVENLLIYCSDEQNYQIGNIITVSGKLSKFSKPTNPGQFNEAMYYKIKNISYKMKADDIIVIDSNYSKLHYYLGQIKESFLRVYETILPKKEAGAIIAMLLGEKQLLEQEINDLYQENGISHILAISGLHISLIGAAVYSLFRKLRAGLIPSTVFSIVIVYCYGILTNFSVSTNRAVVMFIIMLIARIIGKTYDMLSALSLCALIILLQNPLQIFSAGFLLSFGAVLGLAVLLPCFKTILPIKSLLLDAVLVSISAQLMTLPLILFFFYQLPVYSVFINLLIIPSSSALILSALVAGILGSLSLPMGIFLIGGTNYILKFYEYLCKVGSSIPGNLYTVGKPDTLLIIAYLVLMILFVWGSHRYKKPWWILLPICAVAVLITPKAKEKLTITMLDVGQGEAIVIQSETGINYLIDGGSTDTSRVGQNRIQPFLLYQGIDRIDYAIVTHCDQDHINGLVELIDGGAGGQKIRVKNLVLPYIRIDEEIRRKYEEEMKDNESKNDENNINENEKPKQGGEVIYTKREKMLLPYIELEALARGSGISIYYIKEGDIIQDGNLLLRCLHPKENNEYSSANAYSTVISVTYGEFDMLLTGDLEQEGEDGLMESFVDCDVLKVGHHGSKNSTSEAFLSIIKPKLSLISCGKMNWYGHPHKELLERLQEVGSSVYVTTESGAITLKTDGVQLEIEELTKGQ